MSENHDLEGRRFYNVVWVTALSQILRCEDSVAARWVQATSEHWLICPDGLFFHEHPFWYLTGAVLPRGFLDRHPEAKQLVIERDVLDAMLAGQSGAVFRLDSFDWDKSRLAVAAVLAKYGTSLPVEPTSYGGEPPREESASNAVPR